MNTRSRVTLFVLVAAISCLTGCETICDKLDEDINLQNTLLESPSASSINASVKQAASARLQASFFQGPKKIPAEMAAPAEQAAAPLSDRKPYLVLSTRADDVGAYFSFPNASYGQFTAQVSVVPMGRTGLVDGESIAFLEYRQAEAASGPRRYFVGAVYDAAHDGFRVVAGSPGVPGELGTAVPFPNQIFIDLRIQQTATDLTLSTRATPADQSAGGWTTVYTTALPLDPAAFHVYIGVRDAHKKAAFGFNHFAIDGEAIGGRDEYPIIAKIRAAQDSVKAAQAKLAVMPPDLDGARADLDLALSTDDDAMTALLALPIPSQRTYGLIQTSRRYLDDAQSGITRALAAVESGNAATAAAQAPKLTLVATRQTQALGQLLGWQIPRLKLSPDLFTLRIP